GLERAPRARDRVLQDAVADVLSGAKGRDRVITEGGEHQVEAARVLISRDRDRIIDVLGCHRRLIGERGRRDRERGDHGEQAEELAHQALLSSKDYEYRRLTVLAVRVVLALGVLRWNRARSSGSRSAPGDGKLSR